MAWYDGIMGDSSSGLFSGGSGNFGDSSGFDWGDAWDTASDWFGSSGGSSALSGSDSGGTDWGKWASSIGNFFGGSDGSQSSGWNNIFGAMLGGLAGGADAKLGLEAVREKAKLEGQEERKSLGFAGDLEDYYKQKEKARKRTAIDTYGQFSLMDRWAPNAAPAPAVDVPNKPVAGQGGY